MSVTDVTLSALVAASGVGTATISPGRGNTWTVSQVSVEMASVPLGATCDLRKNNVLITPLAPSGDAAGGDPPVKLLSTDRLTVTWRNCTPNVVGTVLFIYDDGRDT